MSGELHDEYVERLEHALSLIAKQNFERSQEYKACCEFMKDCIDCTWSEHSQGRRS